MKSYDYVQRFLFDHLPIRGEHVLLNQCSHFILERGKYPDPIQRLLGEFVAASVLLSESVKLDGILTLQIKGDGVVSLLVCEVSRRPQDADPICIRGLARLHSEEEEQPSVSAQQEQRIAFEKFEKTNDIKQLLGIGQLIITFEPDQGERYQGIVEIGEGSLSDCLENYFSQSEQLETKLWLASSEEQVGGLMLQKLPTSFTHQPTDAPPSKTINSMDEAIDDAYLTEDQWLKLNLLTNTLTEKELLALDGETLLYRLYHEEAVRIFPPAPVTFKCSCSRQRTERALLLLGREETESLLAQRHTISMTCEFCNQLYTFSQAQVELLFSQVHTQPGSQTIH